jgi:hypothetical protein
MCNQMGQHVATQMEKTTQRKKKQMINVALREELMDSFTYEGFGNLEELIRLTNSDVSYISGVIGTSQDITIKEEVALQNVISTSNLTDFQPLPLISARFYERLQLVSTRSIFPTVSYIRSPKRLNYCALLLDFFPD